MNKLLYVLAGLIIPFAANAQSTGTLNLQSTGASSITPAIVNLGVNAALAAKADYSGLAAEIATARAAEIAAQATANAAVPFAGGTMTGALTAPNVSINAAISNQMAYGRYSQGRTVVNLNVPAGSQGVQIGGYASINITAGSGAMGNLAHAIGYLGEANNFGSAPQPLLVGVEGQISNQGGGNVSNAWGVVSHLLVNYSSIGNYTAFQDVGVDTQSGGTYSSVTGMSCPSYGHIPGIVDNSGAATCINNTDPLRPIVSLAPFIGVGSANVLTMQGSSAGAPVTLTAGGAASAAIQAGTAGTGSVLLAPGGAPAFEVQNRANVVNRLTLQGGTTGDYVILGTAGTDATQNLFVNPTGTLYFGGLTPTFLAPVIYGNQLNLTGDIVVGRHIVAQGTGAVTATVGGIVAGSSDVRGSVTLAAAALSTVITFKAPFGSVPFCVVSDSNPNAVASVTGATTGTVSLALASNSAGNTITWHCLQ